MRTRQVERTLLVALGLLIAMGAALLGGVHPEVQLWLSVAAVALLAATILVRFVKRGSLAVGAPFWILAGLVVVGLVQLLPIGAALFQHLQPKGAALTGYSTEGLGALWWRCLSLDPPGTALEVAKLLGFTSVAASAALLVRDRSRALLLLWTIDLAGIVLAFVALTLLLLGADAVFWIYRPEAHRTFVAPFVNPNHAGGFYAAIAFLHLGLSLEAREERRRWVMLAVTSLPLFMVVSTASRGAIVAAVLSGLAFLIFMWRTGRLATRWLGYSVVTALLLGTVALPASKTIRTEFGKRTHWEAVDEERKFEIWREALPMAKDYPFVGIGQGSFRSIYPRYDRRRGGLRVTVSHPENVVVQLLVELGPVLFGVLLLCVGGAVFRFFRRTTLEPLHAAILVPILALFGQNLVDFNLQFPGTGFLFVGLLGAAAGLRLGRTKKVARFRARLIGLAGWGTFLALGVGLLATAGRYGVRYDLRSEGQVIRRQVYRGDQPGPILRAAREAIRRHPADFYLHYLAGIAASGVQGELPLRHFNRALYLNPHSGATHQQIGRSLWMLGFGRQALVHYSRAIQLGVPVTGTVAAELYALLGSLWESKEPAQAQTEVSLCYGGLATPGMLPELGCLLASRVAQIERSEGFAAVARTDPDTAQRMTEWLVSKKRSRFARSAFLRLLDERPKDEQILGALAKDALKRGDLALALYWSRALLEVKKTPKAFERLGVIHRRAGQPDQAERVADLGLARFPQAARLIALKTELLIARGAVESARVLLREWTVGKRLDTAEELRLLQLRVEIEKQRGNYLRVGRLESRIRQLKAILRVKHRRPPPR